MGGTFSLARGFKPLAKEKKHLKFKKSPMFTAYLIDDPSYYQWQNRYHLYFLGILVPTSILSTAFVPDNPVLHNLWLPLLLVFLAGRSFLRLRKATKQIEALSKQTRIRLSETELSLENAAGEVLEKIPIDEETRITALEEYQTIESKFRTIIQQFSGKPRPN